MRKGKEQRKFLRIKAHHLLKYRLLDKDEALSFASDISAGGLMFFSEKKLPLDSVIELMVNFPGEAGTVKAIARVVRVSQLKKKAEGFYIAVEFVNIDDASRMLIDKRINRSNEAERKQRK